jgi:hypothetical protein
MTVEVGDGAPEAACMAPEVAVELVSNRGIEVFSTISFSLRFPGLV